MRSISIVEPRAFMWVGAYLVGSLFTILFGIVYYVYNATIVLYYIITYTLRYSRNDK